MTIAYTYSLCYSKHGFCLLVFSYLLSLTRVSLYCFQNVVLATLAFSVVSYVVVRTMPCVILSLELVPVNPAGQGPSVNNVRTYI